jgi:hypothetical protein
VHETKELDIEELDTLVLASMELGKVPNTWLSVFSKGSTADEHAHLDRSDGI